jgi:hypothetical protein
MLAALFLVSCRSMENDFPDFDYTAGFFPYQYPVRTLILGNYYLADNTNDNNHKFIISAAMGGVYQNRADRTFKYIVDEELCTDAYFEDGSPIRVLPAKYYQMSNPDKIVIPKGHFNGGVEVTLSDEFFNDPLAVKKTYVLPLRIVSASNIDTVLQGNPGASFADPRIASQWIVTPKHFTMFCVKFINPFHGHFLHFGSATTKQGSQTLTDSTYSAQYIERNEVILLTSTGRTTVTLSATFKSKQMTGQFDIELKFESDNHLSNDGINCTVSQIKGSPYIITGTGKYIHQAEEYGNKKRDAIYLQYTITTDNYTYSASDTFVLRDKDIDMELFTPHISLQ